MVLVRKVLNRTRALLRNGREEAELAAEMQFHIDMEIEKNLARGLSEEEARRLAHIAFGGVEQVKEDCRESWGIRVVMDLIRAMRYASRRLVRHKVFTVAVLLALGLCVGGNTAVFTALYSLVYKQLPFDPDGRLVEIYHIHSKSAPADHLKSNPAIFQRYLADAGMLESMSLHTSQWSSAYQGGRSYRLKGTRVAGAFFESLRSRPLLGELFDPNASFVMGRPMVLSESFWKTSFAESPEVLGTLFQIGEESYRVVGILADDARTLFPDTHIFIPWDSAEFVAEANSLEISEEFYATFWALLKPGVSPEQATQQLSQLDQAMFDGSRPSLIESWAGKGFETRVESLRKLQNAWIQPKLFLLQGVSLLILVIGLVNVVNLLLAHSNAHRKEVAVRETLGATRRRIMLQCLTEVGQLSFWGWCLSIVTAFLGIHLLKTVSPDLGHLGAGIQLDMYSLGFSLVLMVVVAVVMVVSVTSSLFAGLKRKSLGNYQQSMSRRSRRAASLLVLVQITMSVILLVGTGLLAKSFWNALNQDSGYDPEGIITARIELAEHRYADEAVEHTRNKILEHVQNLPSVRSAALATQIPTFGYPASPLVTPGMGDASMHRPWAKFVFVSDGYFETMGIEFQDGRDFTATDSAFWQEVNVVEGDAMNVHFLNSGVDGQNTYFSWSQAPKNPKNWNRVVGVVENTRHETLDTNQGEPLIYRPIRGTENREFSLLIKSDLPSSEAIQLVQRSLRELDPLLTVFRVGSLESFMDQSLASRKGLLSLVATYALLALFLSTTGVFGLLAYDVSTHLKEIGIRISIGASRTQVLWHILRKGVVYGAIGLGLGVFATLVSQQLIQQFLYETPVLDVGVYVLVITVLFFTILLASLVPALRAVHINPLVALRQD